MEDDVLFYFEEMLEEHQVLGENRQIKAGHPH
jgi:hypothetical protein